MRIIVTQQSSPRWIPGTLPRPVAADLWIKERDNVDYKSTAQPTVILKNGSKTPIRADLTVTFSELRDACHGRAQHTFVVSEGSLAAFNPPVGQWAVDPRGPTLSWVWFHFDREALEQLRPVEGEENGFELDVTAAEFAKEPA